MLLYCNGNILFEKASITDKRIKTLREDRHGLEENWADETIRRRRRTPRESPFLSGSTVKKPVFKGIMQEMSQIPDGWGKGTPWV